MIKYDFSSLSGDIVTREDFEYEECRKAWNRAIEKYPLAIVYCHKIEDIKNVSGIGEKKFAAMKEIITVE